MQLVSKISNLCDPDPPTLQTDRRTDGQTTCNLNTALCTSASRGKNESEPLSILTEQIVQKLVGSGIGNDVKLSFMTVGYIKMQAGAQNAISVVI